MPGYRTPLVLFALAFALSGCGGDTPGTSSAAVSVATKTETAAPSGPLPKACALLDAAQAQAVLGQPAGLMGDEPGNCLWASQGHPGQIAMLMVQISEEASDEDAQTMFDAMVKAAVGVTGAVNAGLGAEDRSRDGTLAGLGDRAWHTTGHVDAIAARQILVRKGRRLLYLNVTGMRADSGMDARLEQAAREAIPKL